MSDLSDFKRYKIGQAAKMLDLKPYVLRFWEGEFPELAPIRTDTGQRLYTEEHMEIIREIKRLLYDEGLTIEGARKRLEDRNQHDILREVRAELIALRELLTK